MPDRRPSSIVPTLVILFVFVGATWSCDRRTESGGSPDPSSSGDWPALEARPLDGDEATSIEPGDAPVVVNLWATWCAPCIAEMPQFRELRETWSREELRMIGLSVQGAQSRTKIQSFVDQHDVPFEVWFAPSPNPLEAFGAGSVPATYLYTPEGRMIWSHDGTIESKQLTALREAIQRVRDET